MTIIRKAYLGVCCISAAPCVRCVLAELTHARIGVVGSLLARAKFQRSNRIQQFAIDYQHGLLHSVQQAWQLEVVQILVGRPLDHLEVYPQKMVESFR